MELYTTRINLKVKWQELLQIIGDTIKYIVTVAVSLCILLNMFWENKLSEEAEEWSAVIALK